MTTFKAGKTAGGKSYVFFRLVLVFVVVFVLVFVVVFWHLICKGRVHKKCGKVWSDKIEIVEEVHFWCTIENISPIR